MKILFSTSSLFPYRVEWLDALGKHAQVDVYYIMDSDACRNTQWCSQRPKNCSYTLQKSRKLPKIGLVSFDFIKVLKKKAKDYDVILLDGYGFASQILNILYLNSRKLTYYVNIDGMVPKDGENRIVRWLKKQLISRFPYCLCGAKATNAILESYGVPPERIINHPFTSLRAQDILKAPVTAQEKAALRQELGMEEPRIVLAVGQFIHRKGFDVLINAMAKLPEDIGCYIVGGEPTESYLQQVAALGLTNVHFVGFCQSAQLEKYYNASDVFVLPTREDVWGLVINEAMARGLPVITTDKCVAGLDLVSDDENGYIVPVGDDAMLTDRLNRIFADPAGLERMAKTSLEKIAPYTIENMAEIHLNALQKNLKG